MHIEIEMIAHGLGFAGEALNLYGAFILAKDLLEREEELSDRDGLEELTNWLTANGLRVRVDDLDLKKPHAATLILIRKAVLIGKRGLFWLKLGFCCLALYHVLSFFASYAKTHEIERNARPATTKLGVVSNPDQWAYVGDCCPYGYVASWRFGNPNLIRSSKL